jgi:hypothetical protein
MPQLWDGCSLFIASKLSVLHKVLPINVTRDEKRQMGTFQSLLINYLCYLCSQLNNIKFMMKEHCYITLRVLTHSKTSGNIISSFISFPPSESWFQN